MRHLQKFENENGQQFQLLINKTGEIQIVKETEVEKALSQGFSIPEVDEYGVVDVAFSQPIHKELFGSDDDDIEDIQDFLEYNDFLGFEVSREGEGIRIRSKKTSFLLPGFLTLTEIEEEVVKANFDRKIFLIRLKKLSYRI